MAEARATLLSHSNKTQLVTRETLKGIIIPPGIQTDTFTAVPHIELVETIEGVLNNRGVKIATREDGSKREQFAISTNGMRLFGTFDLNLNGIAGAMACMGFRQANDKSMSIQIVVGVTVMVCDNMCMNGDEIALKRKHTSGLMLEPEIIRAVSKYEAQYMNLKGQITGLQSTEITDDRAKSIMWDAFCGKKPAMPLKYRNAVARTYFEPPHEEFASRTLWSLHNAFSEVAKQMSMGERMLSTQKFGMLFNLLGNRHALVA